MLSSALRPTDYLVLRQGPCEGPICDIPPFAAMTMLLYTAGYLALWCMDRQISPAMATSSICRLNLRRFLSLAMTPCFNAVQRFFQSTDTSTALSLAGGGAEGRTERLLCLLLGQQGFVCSETVRCQKTHHSRRGRAR